MVFNSISWGEIFVVGAVGAALTGRRDLPNACRYVGSQIGRVVGLLQGARVRADQFAANNELRQLQNELRSGLRELDQVKSELAVAASSQGMIGRSLGGTTSLANNHNHNHNHNNNNHRQTTQLMAAAATAPPTVMTGLSSQTMSAASPVAAAAAAANNNANASTTIPYSSLPPAYQTERAVMEEEWEKRGIGFRSIAEQGGWMMGNNNNNVTTTSSNSNNNNNNNNNGSELLANLIKENLIFDQYDRVVGAQDVKMEERIEKARNRNNADPDEHPKQQ
jgi:Sec-independent protein translocase protein TatA